MRKSFILHKDSLDVLDDLTDEQCGQLFKAIKAYHCEGQIELNALIKIAFSPFKNQFMRDEIRSRIGEHHWNWKGGITPENKSLRSSTKYKQWRTSVFTRDEFTCRRCGVVGAELNAHHDKAWATHPELRFAIENGITLCKECHIEVHREK
jgi:hypothetical protein